jgi:PAS domain S-box-containing protein
LRRRAVPAIVVASTVLLGYLTLLAAQNWRALNSLDTTSDVADSIHHGIDDAAQIHRSLALVTASALTNLRHNDPGASNAYFTQKQILQNTTGRLRNELRDNPALAERANSLQIHTQELLTALDPLAAQTVAPAAVAPSEDTLNATVRNPSDALQHDAVALQAVAQQELNGLGASSDAVARRHLQELLLALLALGALVLATAAALVIRIGRRQGSESELERASSLHEAIFRSSPQMVITCNLDGNVTALNPAAENLLGDSEAAVLARGNQLRDFLVAGEAVRLAREVVQSLKPGDAIPPRDGDLVEAFVSYLQDTPLTQLPQWPLQFRKTDGSTFIGLASVAPLRDADGEVTGFFILAGDYTVRQHAENFIQEIESQYRDLFEHSTELVAVLAPAGNFLYANPAWVQTLGLDPVSLPALRFDSIFSPEHRLDAITLVQRALSGENIRGARLYLKLPDGMSMLLEAEISLRERHGAPSYIRCIGRDVTELVRREIRMQAQLIASQVIARGASMQRAVPVLLETLGTTLGWDVADFWVIDHDAEVLRREALWVSPDLAGAAIGLESHELRRGEGLPGCVWRDETPLWMHDFSAFPAMDGNMANDSLRSGWGIPVRFDDKVIACLQFYAFENLPKDGELLNAMEAVGASLGQFMARCQQQEHVHDLNHQKESILNTAAEGIFGLDLAGATLFANPAAASLLNSTPAELVLHDLHELLHGNRPGGVTACTGKCSLLSALQGGEISTGQETLFREDGSDVPIEYSAAPMVERGRSVGTVCSIRDISQRYALDRLKDEFVSTVSHELRTPLTSIRGALGLLSAGLMGNVNEKASKLLRIALSNTDRLVRLINDVLDLERMESGRAVLHYRQVDLAELIQQAADTMRPMAEAAGIHIHSVIDACECEADPDRVVQVVTNLLSNAVKFSDSDSNITISVSPGDQILSITVSDEGRGVPTDKLESVFDRFHQVDSTDSRQKGGTGLGLAICRSILQQHGGRIWAEPNYPRGTSFRMVMPRRQSRAPQDLLTSDSHNQLPLLEQAVLVCDDDPIARTMVRHHLQQHGYHVFEAESGEQALELAHKHSLDAILLDLFMPGMNGWETLHRLKSDAATAGIPVVILSVFSSRPINNTEDIHGWVSKPFNEQSLLSALGAALHPGEGSSHILLVEDDEAHASLITETFERSGLMVHRAANRAQAIQMCQRIRPELMVLNLSLPEDDGMQIVAWLRQHYELHKLPLVVYSGREMSNVELDLLTQGPTKFLAQAAVHPAEVEQLVVTMLRRQQSSLEQHFPSAPVFAAVQGDVRVPAL